MRFIQLLFTFIIWIHNQIVPFAASQTSTIEVNDVEDGHPNHQLWRKMTDTGRSSYSDR